MIGYVKGTVEGIFDEYIIVENNGIGYRIFTSGKVIADINSMHKEVKLYTYLNVREDELSLYGFLTDEELNTFKLLISINGIGPKVALSILSTLTVKDLSMAVMMGDVKAITKANGVGKKGAERIIMELKDKLKYDDLLSLEGDSGMDDAAINNNGNDCISDTVLALVSLGYSEFEAMKAINQIPDAKSLDPEVLLKAALKKLF